jgi:hypothetical protein
MISNKWIVNTEFFPSSNTFLDSLAEGPPGQKQLEEEEPAERRRWWLTLRKRNANMFLDSDEGRDIQIKRSSMDPPSDRSPPPFPHEILKGTMEPIVDPPIVHHHVLPEEHPPADDPFILVGMHTPTNVHGVLQATKLRSVVDFKTKKEVPKKKLSAAKRKLELPPKKCKGQRRGETDTKEHDNSS